MQDHHYLYYQLYQFRLLIVEIDSDMQLSVDDGSNNLCFDRMNNLDLQEIIKNIKNRCFLNQIEKYLPDIVDPATFKNNKRNIQ